MAGLQGTVAQSRASWGRIGRKNGDCKTRASPSGKLIICVQLGTPPRDTVQELLARDPREEA